MEARALLGLTGVFTLQKSAVDEIEFRFSRFGGHAKGRFAIVIFAGLIALAIFATMFFWYRLTASSVAFYDHLGGSPSRTMTKEMASSDTTPTMFHTEAPNCSSPSSSWPGSDPAIQCVRPALHV